MFSIERSPELGLLHVFHLCVCVFGVGVVAWEHIPALPWNILKMRCASSRWMLLNPWACKCGDSTRWARRAGG